MNPALTSETTTAAGGAFPGGAPWAKRKEGEGRRKKKDARIVNLLNISYS
jgi:hypothetical protein